MLISDLLPFFHRIVEKPYYVSLDCISMDCYFCSSCLYNMWQGWDKQVQKHPIIFGWWFQRFFIFIPTWGNDPIPRSYFSKGLVQPPTR